jgi:hypothetical protein
MMANRLPGDLLQQTIQGLFFGVGDRLVVFFNTRGMPNPTGTAPIWLA